MSTLKTTYIRFPDEQTGKSLLQEQGLYTLPTYTTTEDGEQVQSTPEYFKQADLDFALDVIGEITIPGTYDPETNQELTPSTTLPGWHINYIGEVPEAWQQYVLEPNNPVRKFAGVE